MPRDLIVFGEDWGGLPSSTQHLVSHLAVNRKVLWVNSIGLRRPRPALRDIKRAWRKLAATRSPDLTDEIEVCTPVSVFHPKTLPAPRSRWGRTLARRLLSQQLKPALKAQGFEDPILWTSLPTAVDMAGELGDRGLVYYCGDDFAALAGVDHDTVSQREAELLQRADLVMTASPALAIKHAGNHTKLLPHGVDFRLFSDPAPRADDLPSDGRPIAGFYGSLSEWLDIELLEQAIRQRPEWHFVFIGEAVIDVSVLNRLPNTHFLGSRAHHKLPGYSQHWNASLLPFRDSAQIRACNPLKLREYLATGTSVISTDFPALHEYKDLVHTVFSLESLLNALDHCQTKVRREAQIAAVAEHDWSVRAAQVNRWLEQL